MNKTSIPNGNDDTALRGHLYQCYGGFADRRIKDLKKERRFFVDQRDEGNRGVASDGLFGWFCGIIADVESDAEVKLTLFNSVPRSGAVDQLYKTLGGTPDDQSVSLWITAEALPTINQLADAIDDIVAGPARKNSGATWFTCRYSSESLRKLASNLGKFWRSN